MSDFGRTLICRYMIMMGLGRQNDTKIKKIIENSAIWPLSSAISPRCLDSFRILVAKIKGVDVLYLA